jgi:membrane-associated protease RseP (regulator of RpoE activity)
MSYLLGVVIFVVAILISIMLHEAGHLVTAKAFGMKATRYFVGFGNTLWSRRWGETEYGVKSIPLGGFVEIMGMSSLDEVDPAEEPRSFRAKPGWQRSIVLLAGSFMHFVIAFVLLSGLALGIGMIGSTATASTTITVIPCVTAQATTSCQPHSPQTPAKRAGLRQGDQIVAIAGRPVHNWNQLGTAIKAQRPGQPVRFTILRGHHEFTTLISLTHVSWHKGAFLGVAPVSVYQRPSPLGAISYAGSQMAAAVTGTAQAIVNLPSRFSSLFSPNRPPNGAVSVVGVGELTGQEVSASGVSWQDKVYTVVAIIASVNVFVGIFNLLPLLPLDGGKLVVVIFESVRSWLARLRRRPDPGMVDWRKLAPVTVAFLVIILGYAVLVIAADIFNPIHLQ